MIGTEIKSDSKDYDEIFAEFVEIYKEGCKAIPENSNYAISDFIIRETLISNEIGEAYYQDNNSRGLIRFAVKPLHGEWYPFIGGTDWGTGAYEGYITDAAGFYFKTDGEGTWICTDDCHEYSW